MKIFSLFFLNFIVKCMYFYVKERKKILPVNKSKNKVYYMCIKNGKPIYWL